MYLPKQFEETDRDTLHALMRAHPFATWVTQTDAGPLVNHLPLMLDAGRGEHGTLVGHVARANPVWREFSKSTPSVMIFQGAQAYISPSWYPSKREHGKVVPTWNYALVHAHGRPRVIDDRDAVLSIVARLTDVHEAGFSVPWKVSDAPADYVDQMLRAIIGIELPIERLVGKWKTSQNRSASDRQGVADGLNALGTQGVKGAEGAAEMARLAVPPPDRAPATP